MNENFNGQNNFNGMNQPPTFEASNQRQMWDNEGFAGAEIFNGDNNFTSGAPTELNEFVDTSAANAFIFGKQKTFGNFAQGNFTSASFGGQGGQFNQPNQPGQNQFK